jgi:glucose/arabinose dehydrogenase
MRRIPAELLRQLAWLTAVSTLAPIVGWTTPAASQGGQKPPAIGAREMAPPQPATAGFERLPTLPFPDGARDFEASGVRYRVTPVVRGLQNPWSIAFLPGGELLVTERSGRLRVVRRGTLDTQPVAGAPRVWAVGQGGLLEVLPHPRFRDNQLLYLSYSKQCQQGATTALFRARFDGKALIDGRDIFVADNCNTGNPHFGSRLVFGPDDMLYMTVGERGDRNRAQNPASHGGKILRLTADGTAPPDNPFAGRQGYKPEIFSLGFRNPQGLAFHPATGVLWSTDQGPQGGDELNEVLPGRNYGWPLVTDGREDPPDGSRIVSKGATDGMEAATLVWTPSIGISGLMVYTGDQFPAWRGNFFVGGLSGLALQRFGFNDRGGLMGREPLLAELRQRIRDVRQGPDGCLYVAIDASPGGVLRVEPTPPPQ